MRIEIFNVEHGQCAVVYCPDGEKIMMDAGHTNSPLHTWKPSAHFYGHDIDLLTISHYDEDHVSDFDNLQKNCNIKFINKNHSIDPAVLLSLKNSTQKMGDGIEAVYNWMQLPPPYMSFPVFRDVVIEYYYNYYGTFTDTNNLSLVTFVHYGNFTILFPGDLEVAGWDELLKDINFRNDLEKVTVLVASHHGRDSGCCERIFNYCLPRAVIISDEAKQYSTQETRDWYAHRVSGCKDTKNNNRKVLTTRSDGNITIDIVLNQGWHIETEK